MPDIASLRKEFVEVSTVMNLAPSPRSHRHIMQRNALGLLHFVPYV